MILLRQGFAGQDLNPVIGGLRFGDRGTVPLAAGGFGPGTIVGYRGANDRRMVGVRLDARGPDRREIVVWCALERFRPFALVVPGARHG